MKENDPLIVMTHTLIENSAPRPQLYQQVRPTKGFAPPHPHQLLLFLIFWSVLQCSSFSVQVLMASWDWSPSSFIAFYCSPRIIKVMLVWAWLVKVIMCLLHCWVPFSHGFVWVQGPDAVSFRTCLENTVALSPPIFVLFCLEAQPAKVSEWFVITLGRVCFFTSTKPSGLGRMTVIGLT